MKKLAIVLILLTSFFSGRTQDLQAVLGIGPSFILGGESWNGTLGIALGVESRIYKINENSFIKSGIGFSLQGAGYDEGYVSGRVRLGYLNLPVLYNFILKNNLSAEVGLQPGLLVHAKDKYEGTNYDYKDYIKGFDVGLPVGIIYMLKNGLSVGMRAVYGLTNMDKQGNGTDHNFLLMAKVSYHIKR